MLKLLLLLFLPVVVSREMKCKGLEFKDDAFGTLVPCRWRNARGMLCLKGSQDTVVWPGVEESKKMAECGIQLPTRPKRRRKKPRRHSRSLVDFLGGVTEAKRRRRSLSFMDYDESIEGSEEFTIYDPDESVSSNEFRNVTYDYYAILAGLVKREWGLDKPTDIEPTVELWIENNITLSRDEEKGIYRALVAPAGQFNPDDSSGRKAVDVVKQLLKNKKDKEDWNWLDVQRISDEFELCYLTDFSTVANEDVLFDAPDAIPLTEEELAKLEQNGTNPKSTLHFWYYKMTCQKLHGRIFMSMVIYTDKMTFDDVARTVQDWINTPETQVKWMDKTVERIKATKKEIIVPKTNTEEGKKCHTVKGPSGRSKSHCEPYSITNTENEKFELWEDKIIKEITPQQFVSTVNKWRRYTKTIYHRQTITLSQRQALKSWIRNAILANVKHHFNQFLML